MKQLFVVIPSLTPDGPMKGAAALCNGMIEHLPVTLVSVTAAKWGELTIDPRVNVIRLDKLDSWKKKINFYKETLKSSGERSEVFSISFSLKADLLNLFSSRYATIWSSVRGNLFRNYRFDYGWWGPFAAYIHHKMHCRFDLVVAMSKAMEAQLRRSGVKRLVTIGNFLDEKDLEQFRTTGEPDIQSCIRFSFLASLTPRKRPELLIDSAYYLAEKGVDCRFDIIGEGPLKESLEMKVKDLNLDNRVTFHGYQKEPHRILQESDYMILPSESEGISRAAMEALFFGVPCILRNVDANSELIKSGWNGYLFMKDEELPQLLHRLASKNNHRSKGIEGNLLPEEYRQKRCIKKLLNLMTQ